MVSWLMEPIALPGGSDHEMTHTRPGASSRSHASQPLIVGIWTAETTDRVSENGIEKARRRSGVFEQARL
jgi:hypothetical protein